MRFELSHDRRNISDDAIFQDMRRVSAPIGDRVLRQRDYGEHGKFAVKTAINRFGSWADAVDNAGLTKSVDRQISDVQLFENLLLVWTSVKRAAFSKVRWARSVRPRRRQLAHLTRSAVIFRTYSAENLLLVWTSLGHQPSYSEVQKPESRYNVTTYERRFRSWRGALEAFVHWANAEEIAAPVENHDTPESQKRKTQRQPNLRLYFRVLSRDRFTCCACGASPATIPGTRLQVDHVVPWSKLGETLEANLQTLCERCNQGKSDIDKANHGLRRTPARGR